MLTMTRVAGDDWLKIDNINNLYNSAFPKYEQRSDQGRRNIQHLDDYHLYYFSVDSQFVGFIGSWKILDFFYVEHLAISSQLRGQGYGQQVLKMFSQCAKNIVLEIDPVIDEVSQKRLHFYLRCGFKFNQYSHIHPNYHGEFAPHQLEILSFLHCINNATYQMFNEKLNNMIMNSSLL